MALVSNQLWRAAGIALCGLLIAGEAAAEICVNVDLRFAGREPVPVTVQAIQSEASAIWQHYGVRIQWSTSPRDVVCSSVQGSFDVLVQYRPSSAGVASPLVVLGSTHVVPAAIDHVGICVDYSRTEHVLETLSEPRLFTLLGRPDIGPADMGRALGRVLAHEIGHVVLGVSRHQPSGLMRKWFTPDELVSRQRSAYTLSKKEIVRLGLRQRELTGLPAPQSLPQPGNFPGCAEVSGHQ